MDYDFFKGKNVLVTGASQGIGLAFAKLALENGARVWATHLGPLPLELEEDGTGIKFIRADVRDTRLASQLLEELISKEGGIDILNTNAAVSYMAPRNDHCYWEAYEISMETNVKGVMNYTHPWLNHLRASGRDGALIIPSSVVVPMTQSGHSNSEHSDWFPVESLDPYAASKAAVQAFAGDVMRTFNPSFGNNQLVIAVPQYGAVLTHLLSFESEQLASQYERRTGESCTPERFLHEVFPQFNAVHRNLSPEETADFTARLLGSCLRDRVSRVVPQPGGIVPSDYQWQ